MKSKFLIGAVICISINIVGIFVFNRLIIEPRDRLELWMTLEEVERMMPFGDRQLLSNPMLGEYDLEGRDIKNLPKRSICLDAEYGVTLGFNIEDRLILINRVDSAEVEAIKLNLKRGQ